MKKVFNHYRFYFSLLLLSGCFTTQSQVSKRPEGFDLANLKKCVGDNSLLQGDLIFSGKKNRLFLPTGDFRLITDLPIQDLEIIDASGNEISLKKSEDSCYFSFTITIQNNYVINCTSSDYDKNLWIGSLFLMYDAHWATEVDYLLAASTASYDASKENILVILHHFTNFGEQQEGIINELNSLVRSFEDNGKVSFLFSSDYSLEESEKFVTENGLNMTPVEGLSSMALHYKKFLSAPQYMIVQNGKVIFWHLSDHVNIKEILQSELERLLR